MDVKEYGGYGGLLLLVAVGLFVATFAATTGGALLAAGLTIAVLAVVGYVLYVLLGRAHDRLRHGKPMIRRRRGGEE